VVIEGPTGIGKSHLLQAAVEEAQLLGMTAASCRATELDRVAPMSTLLSALRRGGLSGIDLATLGGHGNDHFWLVDRVRDLIEAHARKRPLYIAIDDIQWADEFTMMALGTLVPELSGTPIFWAFALSPRTSPCPATSTIDRLVTEGAHRIELGPLCDSAVAEFCAEALGAEPNAIAVGLAARASGNPFLLQLLFTTLRDSGQLAIVDGAGTVLPGGLPAAFLGAVALRLQDLSADARGLLDVGAILNRPFTVHEAAGLLSRCTVELLPIAREAIQAGLLTTDGPSLWFNHDLIREAVYGSLCEPIRIALCREAAASMVKIEGQAPAGHSGYLTSGAAGEGGGRATRLLRDTTSQLAGHRTRSRRGGAPAPSGDATSDSVRAQLMAIRSHGLIYAGDTAGADQAGAEAAMLAGVTGEYSAMVFGSVARGAAARDQGDIETAIKWTQAAVAAADQAEGGARLHHPRLWLARALATADRFDEADAIYAMGQGKASLPTTEWSNPLCHLYRAELRLAQGLLAEAAGEAEKGLESAERLRALQLSLPCLALLLQVAMHRGDLAAAGRYAAKLDQLTSGKVLDLLWPMALYQDAIGEPKLALETAAPLIEALPKRPIFAEASIAGPALVKIAHRAGSRASADAISGALQRLARRNPAISSMAGAALYAAGLQTGDLAAFRLALGHFADSPRPLARAGALQDTAAAEYQAGNRRTAVNHLEEALSLYATAGARYHVATAQQALRDLDLRREPHPERSDPAAYPRLTQSELPVAQLVTEGLTNREIATRLYLSPHTVDSHLRHIFSKFGVNNRVELTRRFAHREDRETGSTLAGRQPALGMSLP
jgi:DNA-binding CsgD family transcriptional regulator